MPKIQLDIPEELDAKIKHFMIDKKIDIKAEAIIGILGEYFNFDCAFRSKQNKKIGMNECCKKTIFNLRQHMPEHMQKLIDKYMELNS